MSKPVLFLAFANQVDHPLPLLIEEGRAIYETLHGLPQSDNLTIHHDQHTTASGIISMLRTFRNRVSIFHYGGHAADAQLFLKDNKSFFRSGLSQLLGLQMPLRLVFLNGCNTGGFIREILGANKKAVVIATSRAVDDPVAVRLATEFYKSLAKGDSIRDAFSFAKGALEGDGSMQPGQLALRGIKLPDDSAQNFPWGLYYDDEKFLNWTLKDAEDDISPLPSYSLLRVSVAIAAIFGIFLWGVIHLGYQNLLLYLSVGPLALVAISSFLFRTLGTKYPRLEKQLGQPVYFAANMLMKPGALLILGTVLVGLFAIFSSVRIDHPGKGPLQASLIRPDDRPASYWQIDRMNQDQTRLLAQMNPVSRKHILSVDGYDNVDIKYGVFTGASVPFKNLRSNPSVIVRIPFQKFSLKTQLTLEVFRNDKPYLPLTPLHASTSWLVGNTELRIPDEIIDGWKRELSGMDPAFVEKVIGFWKNATRDTVIPPLHSGDQLTLFWRQGDSLLLKKYLELKNEILTDVLLK